MNITNKSKSTDVLKYKTMINPYLNNEKIWIKRLAFSGQWRNKNS